MAITNKCTCLSAVENGLNIKRNNNEDKVIAVAGNPNVGKSTIFNALTGMKQHTGNWAGKTVCNAKGSYNYKQNDFILVDIPGTYSLMANSAEEEVARDFICFGNHDCIVIVVDATCLQHNLNLVLQILEISTNVVVCVNLLDEAKKKKIDVDLDELSLNLGVPVVGTNARLGEGLNELKKEIYNISHNKKKTFKIQFNYHDIIEQAINIIEPEVKKLVNKKINSKFVTLKLLENNKKLNEEINKHLGFDILENENIKNVLDKINDILIEQNLTNDNIKDMIVNGILEKCDYIYNQCVTLNNPNYNARDRKIDKLLTSKLTGIPIMLLFIFGIFWLTITGANYPSELIASFLFWVQNQITNFLISINAPSWVNGLFIEGIYKTVAWVVSVMLPPMMIFFPLFTLLEDIGYLPRIAFNMDNIFKKAGAHGKQSLTMCMGFGCNACGVTGCRIIDSPRERLIAIITNNFVPCNGRFPTIIAIITMFFVGYTIAPLQSFLSAFILIGIILLGIFITLLVSKFLSSTILKGIPSSFVLEMPPYRVPQVGKVIVRSIFDRTLFVLGRALIVAVPAGLIIWLMANINIGETSILLHCSNFLDPFAKLIGLDGIILLAFILGFPANEIVIPIIIMSYLSTGSITNLDSLTEIHNLFINNGWTWVTAICVMLFSLLHFPCGTTCLTIKKETGSLKWTAISFLIPTLVGIIVCFIVSNGAKLLGVA